MQNCGIRKGGMGQEFAIELLLVGINVLNHPKIITIYSIFQNSIFKNHVYHVSTVA